jgi:tellurite resistance protein
MALGVDLRGEPTQHDKPAAAGETKPWRIVRQMQRTDFAQEVGVRLLQQSVLRNAVPIAGLLVSAIWNQIVLRRFANSVHTAARQRQAIVRACERVRVDDPNAARVILDGAWLIATVDGPIQHHEALAISKMIDSLGVPQRISVHEASFTDDEDGWFERVRSLDSSAQDALVELLGVVAGADAELNVNERRFLRRLGNILQREIDFSRIEAMVANLRQGSDPTQAAGVRPAPANA